MGQIHPHRRDLLPADGSLPYAGAARLEECPIHDAGLRNQAPGTHGRHLRPGLAPVPFRRGQYGGRAGRAGWGALFPGAHSHHMALLLYKPLTWPTEAFRSEVLALAGRIISSVHRFLKVKTSVPVFARTTGLPSPTPPKKRFKHSPSGTNRMSPIPVSTYTAKAASGVQRRGTYGRCDFSRR